MDDNRCIMCNEVIPEGRIVCNSCQECITITHTEKPQYIVATPRAPETYYTKEYVRQVKRDTARKMHKLIKEKEKAIKELTDKNAKLTKRLETERGRRKMLLHSHQQLVDENLLLIQNKYGKESNPYFVRVGHKKYHEYRIRFETE